jgi:FixJ family two-component response regulator
MVDRPVVHLMDGDAALRDATAETAGHDVRAHPSGAAFPDDLGDGPDRTQPRRILLDIHMPGLSGQEVQLKLNEKNAPRPEIILRSCGG